MLPLRPKKKAVPTSPHQEPQGDASDSWNYVGENLKPIYIYICFVSYIIEFVLVVDNLYLYIYMYIYIYLFIYIHM